MKIGKKEPGKWPYVWRAVAEVGGETYFISLRQGQKVRIAFKPRGTYGFKWHGCVAHSTRGQIWVDEVGKSTGVRYMLEAAGVVPLRPSEQAKKEKREAIAQERMDRISARMEKENPTDTRGFWNP